MKETIEKLIEKSVDSDIDFVVEHPNDLDHGDFSTNVAMVLAKKEGSNPRELAEKFVEKFSESKIDDIEKIEVAGPGFINFYLTKNFFKRSIQQVLNGETNYGRNKILDGKKVLMEYTDPNPFKQFHIGHLVPNAIGEALARIFEWNGAEVTRITYQGDVGLHVAKAIWGIKQNSANFPVDLDPLNEKTKYLGQAYAVGSTAYEEDENAKAEINEINKQVYALFDDTQKNNDPDIENYYTTGRQWSLQHFAEIYDKLGTNFVQLTFESQVSKLAEEIVRENTPDVFELSDGAVIYKGEQDGLHTRVFINSIGLPTYDAKDLGLAFYKKNELDKRFGPFDKSIIITGNEQKEYFKVVLAALKKIDSELSEKTLVITNGLLQLSEGKMSSRTGKVITGESLILDTEEMVANKISDRDFTSEEAENVKSIISVAAIKYAILKQAIGKNIVFDPKISISFDGDSGPYIQYTYTRAKSIIDKATEQKIKFAEASQPESWQTTRLEKLLYRFPEVIKDAYNELAPHKILSFITQLAGEFNSYYGNNQILGQHPDEAYKVALTKSVMIVLQNGLKVLGMKVPEKM